jgi:hypothetical protein
MDNRCRDPCSACAAHGSLARDQPQRYHGRMCSPPAGYRHFPTEDAARKLIYLAIRNVVPAWTRTRNWTTALLAFKIHFTDRLPD